MRETELRVVRAAPVRERAKRDPRSMEDTELRRRQTGVALLAVLWLTVALSAMALATSYLVRTEVEAAGNRIEAAQGYFLARGAIEAAVDSMARSTFLPPAARGDPSTSLPSTPLRTGRAGAGRRPEFVPGQRWLRYDFPGGRCVVEVVPENAKLNVNFAPPEQLAALFRALGLSPAESAGLAQAIVDWRSPRLSGEDSDFDRSYAALPQPYRARHALLEQLEELLPVQGMSRELFWGRVEETPDGGWRRHPSLADLLTVAGTGAAVNPNYAPKEVLLALPGWAAEAADEVIAVRERTPFESPGELEAVAPSRGAADAGSYLTIAQGPFYTLTATCSQPDSAVRRSVRALVEIASNRPLYHQVLAWWDDWPFPNEPPQALLSGNQG